MEFESIFQGIKDCMFPLLDGIEMIFQIMFTTPPVMGLPLGGWFLALGCIGAIIGAVFS